MTLFFTALGCTDQPCTRLSSEYTAWATGDHGLETTLGTADAEVVGEVRIVPGRVGLAYAFDSVGSRLILPGTTEFLELHLGGTIECWVRVESRSGNCSILTAVSPSGQASFAFSASMGQLRVTLTPLSGRGWTLTTLEPVLEANRWHHLGVVHDEFSPVILVDGVRVAQALGPGDLGMSWLSSVGPIESVWLGGGVSQGEASFSAVAIDEFAIFNRALSDDELLAIYEAGRLGKCRPASPAKRGCIERLEDSFDGYALSESWFAGGYNAERGRVTVSDGWLLLERWPDRNDAVSIRFANGRLLCGDFDLQIDYEVEFPPPVPYGVSVLGVQIRRPVDDLRVAGIQRYREGVGCAYPLIDSYKSHLIDPGCPPATIFTGTDHASGRLRMTRVGDLIATYYWDEGWVRHFEGRVTRAPVQLHLHAGSSGQQRAGHTARFDNLVVRSGFVSEE